MFSIFCSLADNIYPDRIGTDTPSPKRFSSVDLIEGKSRNYLPLLISTSCDLYECRRHNG